MIDCQIFDLEPGGHHFTNVLLHTIAALLLFIWLCKVSGPFWSSAFVTALFAIHPLRVESVAWIAERKDVLSAVFFFLTLLAYVRYTRSPTFGHYLLLLFLFGCGLMSKPMLVTTPVILLLLDYWPLNRLTDLRSFWRMAAQKIPLFVLSAASSAVAVRLQVQSPSSVQLPFLWRLENAVVTYLTYVCQIFWPTNLGVFYPHPDNRLLLWQVLLAAAILIAISFVAYATRRARPYLLFGWLWYLIMLLPVIGIIEVGLQGHADRYTYLPHVGLYIALTWFIVDLSKSWAYRNEILTGVGALVVVVLSFAAWKQTSYWRNSKALWMHTLAATKENDVALERLGALLMEQGQLDDALSFFQKALAVRSRSEHSHYHYSLGVIHDDIGTALAREGRLDEAIVHLRQATEFRRDYQDAHCVLGTVLFRKGDLDGAVAEWRKSSWIYPDSAAQTNFGNVLVKKGLLREAADHYEKALQSNPNATLPLNNLAWVISTGPDDSLRNNEIAIKLATRANHLSKESNPGFIRTLAAAYAQAGQFEKAIETARRAAEAANRQGQQGLARQTMEDVDLYQRHMPLRDASLRNAQ